jgi:hypothetical protein
MLHLLGVKRAIDQVAVSEALLTKVLASPAYWGRNHSALRPINRGRWLCRFLLDRRLLGSLFVLGDQPSRGPDGE